MAILGIHVSFRGRNPNKTPYNHHLQFVDPCSFCIHCPVSGSRFGSAMRLCDIMMDESKIVALQTKASLQGRKHISIFLGLSPLPVIVEMKVYRDSLLKME